MIATTPGEKCLPIWIVTHLGALCNCLRPLLIELSAPAQHHALKMFETLLISRFFSGAASGQPRFSLSSFQKCKRPERSMTFRALARVGRA
jgi:hypothetical protein